MAVSVSNTANPANQDNLNTGTTITFTSASFGAAASDRLVFVAVSNFDVTNTITSATIGGVSATKDTNGPSNDGSGNRTSWWWAAVPTGTSGNVVLTAAGTLSGTSCVISVYRVVGANTVTPITDSNTSTGFSTTNQTASAVTVPANGALLVLASGYRFSVATGFTSWTNATNDNGSVFANLNSGTQGTLEVGSSTSPGSISVTATFAATCSALTIYPIALQAGAGVAVNLMFCQQLRW